MSDVDRGETIKCVGAGHSPADIMCTKDHMVSLERLNRVLDVDVKNRVIKVNSSSHAWQGFAVYLF